MRKSIKKFHELLSTIQNELESTELRWWADDVGTTELSEQDILDAERVAPNELQALGDAVMEVERQLRMIDLDYALGAIEEAIDLLDEIDLAIADRLGEGA